MQSSTVHTFRVDTALADDVRALIQTRVRLRFTEQAKPLFFFLSGDTVFTVTGPASVVAAVADEIQQLEAEHWANQQW